MSERKGAKRRDETEETGDVRVASSVCLCVVMMCAWLCVCGLVEQGPCVRFQRERREVGPGLALGLSRGDDLSRVVGVCDSSACRRCVHFVCKYPQTPNRALDSPRPHTRPAIHSFAVPCQSTRLSLHHTYLRHTTLHRPRIIHISHRHVIIR